MADLKEAPLELNLNLCSKKGGVYTIQSIQSQEVSNMVLSNFLDQFNRGINPFIKCVLFDRGGVWCDLCNNEWELNESIKELASQLSTLGYKVAIHSNCDSGTGEELKARNYFNEFRLFFSYEMKHSKSNKGFYTFMLKRLGFKPFECVFIDDLDDNLDKAKEIGFTPVKVSTYSDPFEKLTSIVTQLEELRVLK